MKPTQEQVMALARKAGASVYTNRSDLSRPFHTFSPEQLLSFYNLVCNQALEDAAKMCESNPVFLDGRVYKAGVHSCARAIRNIKEPV